MAAKRLQTHYVEKIWGRIGVEGVPDALKAARVGELWFEDEGDSRLPLLVKSIHTSEKLSIQVHPDDEYAILHGLSGGKEECWLVTHAEPGATLGIGTISSLDGAALRQAALTGELETLMDWKPVQPGDFYFIPAGTVHAIGAGVSLVEVQQNVDVTYRLYDYGRPRELHLDDGVAVSRAEPYQRPLVRVVSGQSATLWQDGPFSVSVRYVAAGGHMDVGAEQAWIVPLKGAGAIDGVDCAAMECWLGGEGTRLSSRSGTDFLIATC
jgi:mannose-6-phosphate isomerase